MKLSIFPKCNPHPSNKSEKNFNAKYASSPYKPVTVEINDEEDLFNIVTSHAWGPSLFNGVRLRESFLKADFIALDIDQGLALGEAEKRCEKANLTALIAPTVSHSEDNHKFRIIFPLVRTIHTVEEFESTWTYLRVNHFPELDIQCSDVSRFFYACRADSELSVFIEGEFLEVQEPIVIEHNISDSEESIDISDLSKLEMYEYIYGKPMSKITHAIAHFFENAHTGLSGEWTNSLNAAVFALTIHGISDKIIKEAITSVTPNALDRNDEYHIDYAIKSAKKRLEVENES